MSNHQPPKWIAEGIQPLIRDDPQQSRHVLKDYEWKSMKAAIDGIRKDEEDVGARQMLMAYDMWDYSGSTLDEDRVQKLYILHS